MKKKYGDLLHRLRSGNEYWKRFSLLLFTTDIRRLMKSEPTSGVKLAKQVGVKPSVISNWLRGGENLTIETMSKIAGALDAVVYIHVAKKGVAVRWLDEKTSEASLVVDAATGRPATVEAHASFQPPSGRLWVPKSMATHSAAPN